MVRAKESFVSFTVIVVLVIGMIVRLKDITSPLADWHSFRQADTASVAREYVKHGINLLVPTYQDLSNIQSGQENPVGYRMVEFPLINGFVAWIYRSIPLVRHWELHVVYRIVDICLSLIAALYLYALVRRIESPLTGLLAMSVFLFLPYNIYYSRTVLPEVGMIAFSLAALYTGVRWIDEDRFGDLVATIVLAAIALLIKPVAAFLLFPLIPYAFQTHGFNVLKNPRYYLLAILSVVPLLWWRHWITQYSAGIPDSRWLLNGNGIRLKGAFFQWLFADRLGRLITGYWGLLFVGCGFLAKKKTNITFWLVISSLAYLVIFATGNVQHDYYQIPLIPAISILIAYGIQFIRRAHTTAISRYGLIVVGVIFSIAFSWYYVRGYYGINNPAIVEAGKAVDQLTPPDALVIAPYMGDTAFLYQTNRRGWPIGFNIDKRIAAGASYYVSTTLDDETRQLQTVYPTVASTSAYTIIHLVK